LFLSGFIFIRFTRIKNNDMSIEIKEVLTRHDIGEFIRFPFRLYRNNPFWLPPVLIDEKNFHNPRKNKALRVNDCIHYLAYKNGQVAGRIMGIIHHRYNEQIGKKRARFFKFDCMDDPDVGHSLITAVEEWARVKGMEEMIGPFGFSDKDPQGLLISGFDIRAAIVAPYNHPYYIDLIEKEGYVKDVDLYEYIIPIPEKIPDFYQRIYDRVSRNEDLRHVVLKTKKDLKPYIMPVMRLINETFRNIYGSYEFDEEEMKKFASDYMMILDVDFTIIITDKGIPVAFLIAVTDIGPALQKTGGRVFPFGIFRILKEMKRSDFIVLMIGGIKESHQGTGIDVMMGVKMLQAAKRRGIRHMHSHLELEENYKVRGEMEKMGGEVCKVHRVYRKSLVAYPACEQHFSNIVNNFTK